MAYENYRKQRNHVNNVKKAAKQSFFLDVHGLIDQYSLNNGKDFWKLAKTLIKSTGTSTSIPPLLNMTTGNIEVEDKDKSNLLNNYFASISTVDDDGSDVPHCDCRTDHNLSSIHITEEDIIDIIKSLNIKKASGIDEISHLMLRNTVQTVYKPLYLLFTKSLELCVYPSTWKIARVLPIFKKGDKNDPSNYRPISLLSTVGKVFERVIHKYLHNFLVSNDLLYKYQCGFLPNNSTVYQLLEIYHNICMNLESKENTCLVFCDVSKAFDRVWHKGLVVKLRAHGIRDQLLTFLENYLSNRIQCVFVNNATSDFRTVTAGVPQGSVLGPLMFLVYMNDIADNLLSISRLFADDTSMSASSQINNEIKTKLDTDLATVIDWAKKWKVTFNPSKTEVIFIGNCPENFHINFGNTPINPTEVHKHLGITFSSNGKWSVHIDNICKSAFKEINIIKKLKYTLSRSALNKIYNTFILPILEYACEVWDGCTKFDEDKLEKVHLEAARVVTGLPIFASRESLYFETGWETLKERRLRRKLSVFYKIYNDTAPEFLKSIIAPMRRENPYNIRNQNDFTLPNYRLQMTRNSFFPSTINAWHNLEPEVRLSQNINQFKHAIKSKNGNYRVPNHFLIGDRKRNILLTRLRNGCSSLNSDLYRVNLTISPTCQCGHAHEDVFHYFFQCNIYTNQRLSLFNSLSIYAPITIDMLLFGDLNMSNEDNEFITLCVQKYIHETKRF